MIRALYTAASGMLAQQQNIDTISNNMANMNTNGFKKSRVDFKDMIYTTLEKPVRDDRNVSLQMGHGTRVVGVTRSFGNGPLSETKNPLDMAIDGEGFFIVEKPNGERMLTRDGSFQLSAEGQGSYLVTSRGEYVLDSQGQRIMIDGSLDELSIDVEGFIRYGDGQPDVRLALVRVENPAGLEAIGDNLFRLSENSGQLLEDGRGLIKQGFIEGSNVDLIEEMTRLIQAQRAYQISSKAIQTADEMEGMANNLRA